MTPAATAPALVIRTTSIRRLGVVVLIGAASAWIWIRLGIYGFGVAAGLAALVPVGVLGAFYVQAGRIADLGVLLGAFGLAWSAFEVWTWTSTASDAAVTIPGWTPVPLATSVALLIIGVAIAIAGLTRGR